MSGEIRLFDTPQGACRLRGATVEDASFQRDLFRVNHVQMFHGAGIDEAMIDNLVTMQYRARGASYREKFPDARWSVVELAGEPIGELIEGEESNALYIVDVALAPEWQGRGIGGALIGAVVASCKWVGGVHATVAISNARSRKMFDRLGFFETWRDDVFVGLRWRAHRHSLGQVDGSSLSG